MRPTRRRVTYLGGIFARDFGPFLKGKGPQADLLNCTLDNLPQVVNPAADEQVQPFSVSRNFGDEVAFSVLEPLLAQKRLYRLAARRHRALQGRQRPVRQAEDEFLEARDGQLYNIAMQGPAVGTAWTGERSLEVLPLDKVLRRHRGRRVVQQVVAHGGQHHGTRYLQR